MEHDDTADGVPALNRRTLQKARERAYLQRFRENLADFPEGEVVPSEHPDFLIKAQPRWIGIELTEYVQESDEDLGSPMRAQERTEDKVLLTASQQHQSKGLPLWRSTSCGILTRRWAVAGYRSSPPPWLIWCRGIFPRQAVMSLSVVVILRGDPCRKRWRI